MNRARNENGVIVVTGGAGFIGSCMVAKLNELGENDIIVVDEDLDHPLKKRNLQGKHVREITHKDDFLERVRADALPQGTRGIFHMGACSSTTETDEAYLQKNNVEYSKTLCRWCLDHGARFIYASSAATYGDGSLGYADDPAAFDTLRPLNLYGQSKLKFDLWVRDQGLLDQVIGFKFFNVFGPNEQHKGDMQSLISKAHAQILETGRLKLFKSHHPDWANGESVRDFVYIKDILNVLWYVWQNSNINGVFNLGTGQAKSWNQLAAAVFKAMDKAPLIDFMDMPEAIRNKYQYHTQADMSRFFKAAKPFSMTPLAEAVDDYVRHYLTPQKTL